MFSDEELNEFKIEADELLSGAENALLAIDRGEPVSPHFDSIFRAYHSVKGAAGMLQFEQLQQHMHQLENLFVQYRDKGQIAKAQVDQFLEATDVARRMLAGETIQYKFNSPSESPVPKSVKAESTTPVSRVILVDDEEDIVESLSSTLQTVDLEVHGFTEASKAIEQIPHLKPDLIISDIAMPQVSGIDLLAKVRQYSSDLPVILVSGRIDKENLMQALRLGVEDVIEKPFDINHVISSSLKAIRKYKLMRLLNKSINIVFYQFADIDNFLVQQKRQDLHAMLKSEIENLLLQRRELRRLNTK